MDALNIYNGYLTGEERAYAIEIAEANNMIDKGMALLEMCIIQGEQIKKDAELKVFKESGTYDDYAYLMEEAEKATEEKKQGAFVTIIEGIIQLITSLFKGVASLFKKADPQAKVDVDVETDSAMKWTDKFGPVLSTIGDTLSGAPTAILSLPGKIAEVVKDNPLKTAGATATAVTVAVLQAKFDILDKAKTALTKGLKAAENKADETFGKENVDKVRGIFTSIQGMISSHIQPVLNKFTEALKKAGQAVKDGAEVVKDKVTGKKDDEKAPQEGAPATDANNPQATPPQQGTTTPTQPATPQAQAVQNYATNQQQPQQMQTRAYTANPNEGDQGRQYTINLQGQVVGIKDAYGTQLDVNNTPLPQSIQNKINQIKSTGKLESVEDMIFDEDYYTMEFSEEEQAYIITDTREPELTIEQSIYGEVEDTVEEESLADLLNSL